MLVMRACWRSCVLDEDKKKFEIRLIQLERLHYNTRRMTGLSTVCIAAAGETTSKMSSAFANLEYNLVEYTIRYAMK
jgi:hypothetical protein